MGRKKKLVVGPVVRDPREAEPRVICPICEASVREDSLVSYLGPDGSEKQRCEDCDSTARAAATTRATPAPPRPPPAPEVEKIDKLAVVTAERNRLVRLICDLPEIGLPSGRTMDDAAAVLARVPVLLERSRGAVSDTEHYVDQARELRETLEKNQTQLADALQRVRDLEVLLGFDMTPTSRTLLTKTEPWMLDIAAQIAHDAPETLDEHSLVLLLVDTLHRAFGHRTVESGRTMEALTATPAGAALLGVEEAARHVSVVLRATPLRPIDLCKDAITEAWQALHVASTKARAAVLNEMNHLIQLELAERERARPKVAPPGAGKQFRVTREPEPPPQVEDEDEDETA